MSSVALAKISEVKTRHQDNLTGLGGVTGIGVTADEYGTPEIVVFVESLKATAGIPHDIEGYTVRLIETGTIKAY